MNKINLDMTYIISNNLDFLSKLRFRNVPKYLRIIKIYNFDNIPKKYLCSLNNNILLRYPCIRYLNAFGYDS